MQLKLTGVAGVLAVVLGATTGAAQPAGIAEWRSAHEAAIVEELRGLVSLPNVAGNDADMQQNAAHLQRLFTARQFKVETVGGPGSPIVFASLDVANAAGTLTFYIHYDGQPVDASEWTRCQPFTPCLWGANGPVADDPARTSFDPEWRMYGRSTSDDKGPIVALLNAVDALRATASGPRWNVRVVLDGEEEAGSANFHRFATARAGALKTDLAVTLDGPRHPSGRPTVYFGVRGGAGVTVTVYGARGDLHSGNYGNWAPDPSMRLAKLLATMKDDAGHVLIKDFYRDVRPLTATEKAALAAAPDVEAVLARDFAVATPERPDERLEAKLNQPTLSILEMSTSGISGRSAIPGSATARIEVRMVKDLVRHWLFRPRTTTVQRSSPATMSSSSPGFSSRAGLACCPFHLTRPPSTAIAARLRVLKKRATQSHLSMRCSVMEDDEFVERGTFGRQRVLDRVRIGMAQRHATDQLLPRPEAEDFGDDAVVVEPGHLGAGVEAAGARGEHHILKEHAVVEPAALPHAPVDAEDQADGRTEEFKIAAHLRLHAVRVALADAEQTVKPPADLAPARQVRLEEFRRVVIVIGAVAWLRRVVGGAHGIDQALPRRPGQHMRAPGLEVGAGGRAAGDRQYFRNQVTGNVPGQEGAHRMASAHDGIDRRRQGVGRHVRTMRDWSPRRTTCRPLRAWRARLPSPWPRRR